MGLLTNISDTISNSIASLTNSMAQLANSYISTGSNIMNTGVVRAGNEFNALSDQQYFDFMETYHFVSALIDILYSCIDDVLNKNKFQCTINNDELHTDRANKFIEESHLKQFLRDNLREMIYRGVFSFGIDYRNAKLYAFNEPYNCKVVTNISNVIGYEIDGKIISTSNVCCYFYKLKFDGNITNDEKDIVSIPEEIRPLTIKFKKYTGQGLFNNKLSRIFQMYSLETAMYYLGLRESMKPTLLAMSTGGANINAANAVDMANAVEDILNAPTTGLSQLIDPTVYMNQLVWSMLNNVKVVPAIEQYNNISDVGAGDMSSKRDKLQQEIDRIQKELLAELTIPNELFGGESNRWESYSKSDRFMTTIDNMLASISLLVKRIISKYTGIDIVSINFDLDTSSLTASFDQKSKVSMASERFSDISRLLDSIKSVVKNKYVVPEKAFEYMRNQIASVDSKLGEIIIDRLEMLDSKSNDDEDDDDE